MRVFTLLFAMLLPHSAFSGCFQDAGAWDMQCTLTPEARADGYCIDPDTCPPANYHVIWNRDQDDARFLWHGGAGKGMQVVRGFTSVSGQYVAHFTMSPATAKYNGDGDGFIEIDPSFFSVRFTGEAALTYHSITYGGMKPLSSTGTCTIKAISGEDE